MNDIKTLFDNQLDQSLRLRTSSYKERIIALKNLKKWILNNLELIHEALLQDLKKPHTETEVWEVYPVSSAINKAIRNLKTWSKAKKVNPGMTYLGTRAWIQPEPKGRCLIIAPWNFPFQLVCSPLVSCIAAGNTAILKPSENTPHTSALIKKMIAEVFDPKHITVVEGSIPETQALLELPFDHIFFTGSTNVGKIVMTAAAKHLTSVTLELGGKSPVIIDHTANIKDAAKKIVWGRFSNNGQTCIAPDYIFISKGRKDEFVQQVKHYLQELFDEQNQGMHITKTYGRIVNNQQHQRLSELLEDAKQKGAVVELGGKLNQQDKYFEPTLISNIDDSSRIWKEEIFGPIMPIKEFDSLDTVLKHINDNLKPLSLYLFSKSKRNQNTVRKNTSAGTMAINDVVIQYAHPNLPFGGVNHSGIGKSHGHFGFLEFSNQKAVLKQRVGPTNAMFFYPPFTDFKKKLIKFMIKYM
ncbi:MAG: aldehyde dehydrogenase family protein [Reichenbachiella sp.]